ncbi:MAG TPA: P-loop NTPase [archaeon]|nr:P-loop NTPase [archaeon]
MTKVIAISSPKGGVGKTTVAANLAVALSTFGKKVIVVDCNLSTPHLTYYISQQHHKLTLNDALLGKADIKHALYQENGVMYVPASSELNDIIDVDVAKLKKNISRLVNPEMIDYVILDSAPGLGREALSVMEAADEIVFVAQPLEPMLEDISRGKEVLKEVGNKQSSLVLNMVRKAKYEVKQKDFDRLTKTPVVGSIAFDENVIKSVVARKPLLKFKPNSPASLDFMDLAANMLGVKYKKSAAKSFMKMFEAIRSKISL